MNYQLLKYNSISWDSYTDGPGRRVVLFLQGCEYRCPWCHSPHTQDMELALLFFESLCIGCSRCEKNCPAGVHSFSAGIHQIHRERCTGCGLCVEGCPQSIEGASGTVLKIVPKTSSIKSIYDLMRPQLEYCGALTISGGEPLLQWGAVKELLALCKAAGVETAIETTLTADERAISELLSLVDLWLVGLRPLEKNNPLLNVPDESITTRNLGLLSKDRVCIRYPIIPGYTDSSESLGTASDLMERAAIRRIEVLPFNQQAGHYYLSLGRQFNIEDLTATNLVNQAGDFFRSRGLSVLITQ
jgi:pyruvate formate lyase activating enzyme